MLFYTWFTFSGKDGGWEGQVIWVSHDQQHHLYTKLLEPYRMFCKVQRNFYFYSWGNFGNCEVWTDKKQGITL